MNKVLIIGLDGATWDVIKPLAEEDKLPVFKKLIETLEVLMDEATLKRLKKGEEELKTGDYVDAEPEEIEELLR